MNLDKGSRLSNPWWIVFAAFLGLSVSAMTILNFSISILIKPISAEFEWGRSTVSSAVAVATLVLAISAPVIGRLIDIWGSRLVTLVAICLSSIATALMSLATGDATAFLLLSIALGLCLAGQTPPAYEKPSLPHLTGVGAWRLASGWRDSGLARPSHRGSRRQYWKFTAGVGPLLGLAS